ncbi:class II aldolase/adducin family protein [Spirillospora sp. NPDC047279]|uniref:class II aldolase/adducin family protein n=1 Tax=Spirillospora sp. NPDC047279 TaxID=3155478 RepID=UPI0033E62C9E
MSTSHVGERTPHEPFAARTPAEERLHRKQRLAAAYRVFAHYGFDEGAAGYITARDPERTDCFWVNPFPMSFRQVRVRDLQLVDSAGEVLVGDWPVSRSALMIHSQVHAARPEVVCVAHAHSMYGKTFASLHRPLQPITQDACIFFEDHGVGTDDAGRVANNAEVGKRITEAIGGNKAAIVGNHGIFTVGESVDEAAFWFVSMEHSCQAELMATAAGEPRLIPPETARAIRGHVGFPLAGWYSAQPIFDWVIATQPDCLDEG